MLGRDFEDQEDQDGIVVQSGYGLARQATNRSTACRLGTSRTFACRSRAAQIHVMRKAPK